VCIVQIVQHTHGIIGKCFSFAENKLYGKITNFEIMLIYMYTWNYLTFLIWNSPPPKKTSYITYIKKYLYFLHSLRHSIGGWPSSTLSYCLRSTFAHHVYRTCVCSQKQYFNDFDACNFFQFLQRTTFVEQKQIE
jgi:hypothetical protein